MMVVGRRMVVKTKTQERMMIRKEVMNLKVMVKTRRVNASKMKFKFLDMTLSMLY